MKSAILLAMLVVWATAAAAGPLGPANTEIAVRSYALGVLPLDGRFTQFGGALDVAGLACRVALTIDVASLRMDRQALAAEMLAPDMLDAATYPGMRFEGACVGGRLTGQLTMHGQTHPLSLSYVRDGQSVVAEGSLRRGEWGVAGRPLTAGETIRIRLVARLENGSGGAGTGSETELPGRR